MQALEPVGLLFFEEPAQPDDFEGLQRLRLADPQMDLATGERLYSKWEYRRLLEGQFVDVIQPRIAARPFRRPRLGDRPEAGGAGGVRLRLAGDALSR